MFNVGSVDSAVVSSIEKMTGQGALACVAAARLFIAWPKGTTWTQLAEGYLALSVESGSALLTLVSMTDLSVLFIHELYYKFSKSYQKLSDTVYSFPSELGTFAVQFLMANEAKNMDNEIRKASPKKQGLLSRRSSLKSVFQGKRRLSAKDIVVSMPVVENRGSGMTWDPQSGYVCTGNLYDLPEEYRRLVSSQPAVRK